MKIILDFTLINIENSCLHHLFKIYDKFYNNPDKTKQDRYQAWLKMVAKDIQVNESSKLLTAFAKPNLIAKKG